MNVRCPLIDFIRTLVKPGGKRHGLTFGARGWTASISANIFGFTAPLRSEDMSWNFNPMAGPGWRPTFGNIMTTHVTKILKETGYELIKSSAQFATGLSCGVNPTEPTQRLHPHRPNTAHRRRGYFCTCRDTREILQTPSRPAKCLR